MSSVNFPGEAKMTKIFAVYLQASGFPCQPSEYAFECCLKQLGQYGISLSYSSPDVVLVKCCLTLESVSASTQDMGMKMHNIQWVVLY